MSSQLGSLTGLKLGVTCCVLGAGFVVFSNRGLAQNYFSETEGFTEEITGNLQNTSHHGQENMPQYRHPEINMTAPSHQLWPNDSLCSKMRVRPGEVLQGAWLLSFPRSGNTWTRYLIEAATGLFTTSVYHERLLVDLGFQGEMEDIDAGTTLLRKTHDSRWIEKTSEPVILLVRDPHRAIASFWSWMMLSNNSDGYKIALPEKGYKTPAFHMFVWAKILEWRRLITEATTTYENMTTLYYEDLLQDPIREIRRLLKFLKVPPDEGRLRCLKRHLEGPFKGAEKVREPFSTSEKRMIAKAIRTATEALKENGFKPLPDYAL